MYTLKYSAAIVSTDCPDSQEMSLLIGVPWFI